MRARRRTVRGVRDGRRGTQAPTRCGRGLTDDAPGREKLHPQAPPCGKAADGSVAVRRRLSYDGFPRDPVTRAAVPGPRAIRAPEEARARDQSVPRPPLRPGGGRGRRQRSSRRRTTSSARLHRALLERHPATRSAWTCPRRSRRGPRRALPAGRADARGVALGRDAAQGPPARRSTSTSRSYRVPGTDVERTQRGFFARLRIEPFGPGAGVLPPRAHAGRAARRIATGSCARPASTRRPVVGLYDDPAGDGCGGPRRRSSPGTPGADVTDDDGVRHRLWVVDRPTGEDDRRDALRAVAGSGPVYDRRRPPPLRDRAPLPRRAADDALVRGGPGVRLPADAVPRVAADR